TGEAAPPSLAEPDAVVVLLELAPDAGPPEHRAVHHRLRAVLDAVEAITGERRAVVSGTCREPADFPAALAETRDVDAIAAALGGRADVVGVDELTTLRLVVDGGRADVAVRFAERCLGPLRRSDDATGGDLVETLRSYLASGAQVRATAKALGVHENTVRYRLGRIEHVTGLDMRSFDALLAARLAFQVDGLSGG
ncbi:MAG: helix-turn-helix domain-containing protein, partial [Actinomycetota bacterium]|nr:helix-turn-helix domain-containing protein [Actinomycetota bacterium]